MTYDIGKTCDGNVRTYTWKILIRIPRKPNCGTRKWQKAYTCKLYIWRSFIIVLKHIAMRYYTDTFLV